MILVALSSVVAAGCVLASSRRLALAITPMHIDPRLVVAAFDDRSDAGLLARLPQILAEDKTLASERRFFVALATEDDTEREALIGEELLEIESRAQRWVRVPRVCASIATSAGFLFASIALLNGLAIHEGRDWQSSQVAVRQALGAALGALALGIAAASFCAAVHMRARRLLRERMSAVARLVDSVERGAAATSRVNS